MVDPVGVTLGAIALIAPVYDACDRAYSGLKIMARFGQDFQTLWRKLEGYWTTLYLLMERNSAHLRTPPDPRDPNHKVTKVILDQLKELNSQFEFCEKLIAAQLKHSEIDLAQLGSSSNISNQSQTFGTDSTVRSDATQNQKQKTSFFRKATPGYWRKRSARNAAETARAVSDGRARNEPDRSSESESTGTSVRDALRVLSIEGISDSALNDDFRRIQQASGTWVHVKWAHHIKADFERSIVHIQDAVHILADILALRDLGDPRSLLRAQLDMTATSSASLLVSRSLLMTLHGAIGRLQKQSGGTPMSLSVAIFEDSAEVWKQAAQTEPELPLGDSGLMLWVQLQDSIEAAQSTFLMVEATPTRQGNYSEPHPTLQSLPRFTEGSPTPGDAGGDTGGYAFLGVLPADRATRGTTHKVFAEKKEWRKLTTLKDFLKRKESLDNILSKQILADLFHRLLEAYLTAVLIEPSCSNFQTGNITYFQPSDKQYDGSNPDWLLQFYVTCGFGHPAPEQRLGMQTGPFKDPNAAVVELGLMLFELGSHRTIEYQTQTGKTMSSTLRNARKASLLNINEVEVKYGTRFADVISVCLQANTRNHEDVVRAAIVELEDIRNEMDREDSLQD